MGEVLFNKLNPFFRYGSKFLLPSRKYNVVAPDCRLLYVNEGEVALTIKNTEYHLKSGNVFYCPAGIVYRLENAYNYKTVVTVLNFDLTDKNSLDTEPRTPEKYSENSNVTYDAFFDNIVASDCFLSDYKVLNNAEGFSKILKIF